MQASIVNAVTDIHTDEWNGLAGAHHPFLRHEFLAALESSGSVSSATGWEPCHIALYDGGRLCGALPLYRKSNSWGEFVFDWAWSDAYHRAGLPYYPKLVSAVPFTPATSPRFLSAIDCDPAEIRRLLTSAALQLAGDLGLSSLHLLFIPPADAQSAAAAGMLLRKDCQFHWQNRGYRHFDDFLGELSSAKRKKIRRERRRIREAGIRFRHLGGAELDQELWRAIMPLYAATFRQRGREPYLNEAFFTQISATLAEHILVILAIRDEQPVATAICFQSDDTLYGRYWGSSRQFHSLHFETCYYQGIEYCIDRRLERFEPGTQGEHKISRGFVPTETWSAHWLSDPRFSVAIEQYLNREKEHIDQYIELTSAHVPYRKTSRP